jgi:AcrR family transcriptional regulator
MSARPDVSAERKKQILETAMLVFSRKGLHQAHMDDIVKQSGLSIGTIYWYFSSKDE